MLVLSRGKNESIIIGDEVEVTVVDVRGEKVRLGITAPRSIPVHRREVYESIRRENTQKRSIDDIHLRSKNESLQRLLQHKRSAAL